MHNRTFVCEIYEFGTYARKALEAHVRECHRSSSENQNGVEEVSPMMEAERYCDRKELTTDEQLTLDAFTFSRIPVVILQRMNAKSK